MREGCLAGVLIQESVEQETDGNAPAVVSPKNMCRAVVAVPSAVAVLSAVALLSAVAVLVVVVTVVLAFDA